MAPNWILGSEPGDPLNVVLYSSIVHRRSREKHFFMKRGMVQKQRHTGDEDPFERGPRAPVRLMEKMGAGDGAQQVRIPMTLPLERSMRSSGTTWEGNATDYDEYTREVGDMVGNEERMRTLQTKVYTQNMQHATAVYDPHLQDLRLTYQASVKATDLLSEWFANAREELYLDALYERWGAHITGSSLGTVETHPNRLIPSGAADINALGQAHRMDATFIRGVLNWIETTGLLSPIEHNGAARYLMLVHPHVSSDIRRDPEVQNALNNAAPRSYDNPLFTAADFEFEGIFFYSYSRIRTVDSSFVESGNKRRNILLGADALAEAETYRPMIVPRTENKYRTVAGWAVKAINGQARFDYKDKSNLNPVNQSSAEVITYTSSGGDVTTLAVP